LSCYFWSVQHLPSATPSSFSTATRSSSPRSRPFFLHEPTGRWHWPLVFAALGGVALIVGRRDTCAARADRPDRVDAVGNRVHGGPQAFETEHPLTILVWFPMATIPLSLIATLHTGRAAIRETASRVAGHVLIFLTALAGQVTLNRRPCTSGRRARDRRHDDPARCSASCSAGCCSARHPSRPRSRGRSS
jgi:hypothetical protein